MTGSLFHDIRAAFDGVAASDSSVTLRDLVAIGQVTQHALDSSVALPSREGETQDGGGDHTVDGLACVFDSSREDYNPFLMCDEHIDALVDRLDGGDSARTVDMPVAPVASATITSCDIEADEAAEQEAAERAFLRSFGMGTWLTSQPRRFRYASSAYPGSSC